jgi:hypothetical protein
VGEIINISKGGLEVHFALYDRDLEAPSEVTIFFTTDRFYLRKIPCKTVSDSEIGASLPFNSMSMRRCGLQFGELNEKQKSQLDFFLSNYTVGST